MFRYRTVINLLFGVACISLLIWFFSDIVLYILISLVISSIIRPLTDYIDNLELFGIRMPRLIAVGMSFGVLASVVFLLILLFQPLFQEQIHNSQEFSVHLRGMIQDIQVTKKIGQPLENLESFLNQFQEAGKEEEKGYIIQEIKQGLLHFFESFQLAPILQNFLSIAGKIFIYLLAVSFITFFLLYEKGLLRRNLLAIVPNAYFEVVVNTVYKIERLLSNYLIGLLLQVSILFTIIAIGLWFIGAPYALPVAAFAAFINLIPYLGPLLGFIFGVVVIISTGEEAFIFQDNIFLILKTMPVFALAQLTDNLVLQPIIFSKTVKAHPLEIFLIIFVGAALAGGLGMIAAIPVYTILRVSYLELRDAYYKYYIFQTDQTIPTKELSRE